MSREANMEMERSRRQHEHEKKFGKDRDWENDPRNVGYVEAGMRSLSDAARRAEELRHKGQGSYDPLYSDSKKNK